MCIFSNTGYEHICIHIHVYVLGYLPCKHLFVACSAVDSNALLLLPSNVRLGLLQLVYLRRSLWNHEVVDDSSLLPYCAWAPTPC